MNLSRGIQEALLVLLCYDQEGSKIAKGLVPPEAYDPCFAEIAEEAIGYGTQFGAAPGEHTLDLIDRLKQRKPDRAKLYEDIFRSMELSRAGINREYVLREATTFARYQQLRGGLAEMMDALDQDDRAGVEEAESVARRLIEPNVDLFDPGVRLSDRDRVLAMFGREDFDSMSYGIKSIDALQLGPGRKQLHLMLGPAKAGKSWHLVHLVKMAVLQRIPTVVVTLEMGERAYVQRIFQSLFSLSKRAAAHQVLRFAKPDDESDFGFVLDEIADRPAYTDPKIRKFIAGRIDRLLARRAPVIVKQYPTSKLSTRGLEAYLDNLQGHGIMPGLLIVDYPKLMDLGRGDLRLALGRTTEELRGIAVERDLRLAVVAQASKVGAHARVMQASHVSEDWSQIATADTVWTYNQTPIEKALGLARIHVAEAREESDGFMVLISQCYGLGQFVVESRRMPKDYFDDLAAWTKDRGIFVDGENEEPRTKRRIRKPKGEDA